MSDRDRQKYELLNRIEMLLQEAHTLPKGRESWERREEIEWEILQLCRKFSNMSTGPLPYWTDDEEAE